MTPEQQMTFAIIIFALAIGMIVHSSIVFRRAKKIVDEARVKTESAKEEIEKIKSTSIHHAHRPRTFGMMKRGNEIIVYMDSLSINGRGMVRVDIKIFYINDDEDFARLEAQELLDHLNEK